MNKNIDPYFDRDSVKQKDPGYKEEYIDSYNTVNSFSIKTCAKCSLMTKHVQTCQKCKKQFCKDCYQTHEGVKC